MSDVKGRATGGPHPSAIELTDQGSGEPYFVSWDQATDLQREAWRRESAANEESGRAVMAEMTPMESRLLYLGLGHVLAMEPEDVADELESIPANVTRRLLRAFGELRQLAAQSELPVAPKEKD